MPGIVVVGLQYGDEGKGKIIDHLAEKADMVVRYSGGNNAGHTVVHNGETYKLHLIPSGILHPEVTCVLGNGVVIDLPVMLTELNELSSRGVDIGKIFISNRAHVILPIHKVLDQKSEEKRGKDKIGTTGRGIGPVYKDKIGRVGIRIADLALPTKKLKELVILNSEASEMYYGEPVSTQLTNNLKDLGEQIKPFIRDTSDIIEKALFKNKKVLFEGAQGLLIDVDHGTYPYVTSSNSCAGNACVGAGIGPTHIDAVIGVTKAYTTRVGAGPFPSKVSGETEETLRKNGNEYGTTTGRPRDCGWLDLKALKYASRINSITHLAITKLDVLSGLEEIRVCYDYEIDEIIPTHFPASAYELEHVQPILSDPIQGWKEDISNCKKLYELPINAQRYVGTIQSCCGVPLTHIGVGQSRNQVVQLIGNNIWNEVLR